jgi:transcriptional regulator with XRE-family HTH domain
MESAKPQASCDGMATRLQCVRLANGFSKAALARMVNLSPTALANIERGAQSGVEVIAALAKALGVSPAWLAFDEGPQLLPSRRRGRPPAQSAAPVD